MTEQMEIVLRNERKAEVIAVLQLFDEMTPAEQREMLVFMEGARFAKSLERRDHPGMGYDETLEKAADPNGHISHRKGDSAAGYYADTGRNVHLVEAMRSVYGQYVLE